MKQLASEIFRQRLLIEGYYGIDVDEDIIREYFTQITDELDLTIYGDPIIFSPAGMGKEGNQGYDAFVPLIDSGISLYIWTGARFLAATLRRSPFLK